MYTEHGISIQTRKKLCARVCVSFDWLPRTFFLIGIESILTSKSIIRKDNKALCLKKKKNPSFY